MAKDILNDCVLPRLSLQTATGKICSRLFLACFIFRSGSRSSEKIVWLVDVARKWVKHAAKQMTSWRLSTSHSIES
jgi:hypothetical protein